MTPRLGVLLLALVPLVPWSQSQIDRRVGDDRAQMEVLYLWSGEQVRNVFPGLEGLAADVYWLRTVQYYGGQKLFSRQRDFALLRPLVEITTTLDPRLEIAYRYGAVFLSEAPPTGAGRPHEGIEVLEKGVRNLPDSWRLRQHLGFFHYLYLGDSRRAAAVLEEAAELPGAAFWLRTLAADLLARGGDRASSRKMWQQIHDQEEEGILRENARVRLAMIDSLDLAEHLTALVGEYERRFGHRPEGLRDLQRAGLWRGRVEDLTGVPFRYDVLEGRVSISRESALWRPEPPAGG
jgi:hypothetical protein